MHLAFYFDQTRCTGCFTCIVACKDWHDVPAGPASWRRVRTIEEGKYPEPFVTFLSTSCCHCAQPACMSACPVDAINKREQDGIVIVDREVCLGGKCRLCLEVCPYGAPQFGAEPEAKMQKCDFCIDRWSDGKKPVCVASCPTRALDAGTMDDMKDKHGENQTAVGFDFDANLKPSIVFKPRSKARPNTGARC